MSIFSDKNFVKKYRSGNEIEKLDLPEIVLLTGGEIGLFCAFRREAPLKINGAKPRTVLIDDRKDGSTGLRFLEPDYASIEFDNITFKTEREISFAGHAQLGAFGNSASESGNTVVFAPVRHIEENMPTIEQCSECCAKGSENSDVRANEHPAILGLRRYDSGVISSEMRFVENRVILTGSSSALRSEESSVIPTAFRSGLRRIDSCVPSAEFFEACNNRPKKREEGTMAFTFNDCTFESYAMDMKDVHLTVFNNCTFNAVKGIVISNRTSVVFNNCVFNEDGIYENMKILAVASCKFNGCTFKNCDFVFCDSRFGSVVSQRGAVIEFNGCKIECNREFIKVANEFKVSITDCEINCKTDTYVLAAKGDKTALDVCRSSITVEGGTFLVCTRHSRAKVSECAISVRAAEKPCMKSFLFSDIEIDKVKFTNLDSGIICATKQASVHVSSMENDTGKDLFIDLDASSTPIQSQEGYFVVRAEPPMVEAKIGDKIDIRTGRVIPKDEIGNVPEEKIVEIDAENPICICCCERRPVMICENGHFCCCKECLRQHNGGCPTCRCDINHTTVPVLITEIEQSVLDQPLILWSTADQKMSSCE
jgi:hypothetical protein